MGFLPVRKNRRLALDRDFLEELAELIRRQGVASNATTSLVQATRTEPLDEAQLVDALRATLEAVDASPHPEGEWDPARDLLGDELLARLFQISTSSLRRYAAGERRFEGTDLDGESFAGATLEGVIFDGSWLHSAVFRGGIRRWFERRRTGLDGATPAELLESAETEDDARLERVLTLAEELMGAGAAA